MGVFNVPVRLMALALLTKISIFPNFFTASCTASFTFISSLTSTMHGKHCPPASSTVRHKPIQEIIVLRYNYRSIQNTTFSFQVDSLRPKLEVQKRPQLIHWSSDSFGNDFKPRLLFKYISQLLNFSLLSVFFFNSILSAKNTDLNEFAMYNG